jgi:hypothetical protein
VAGSGRRLSALLADPDPRLLRAWDIVGDLGVEEGVLANAT